MRASCLLWHKAGLLLLLYVAHNQPAFSLCVPASEVAVPFPAGIALGLCIAHAGNGHGTVGGIETSVPNKVFSIFNALGDIAFAFSFSGGHMLQQILRAVETASQW